MGVDFEMDLHLSAVSFVDFETDLNLQAPASTLPLHFETALSSPHLETATLKVMIHPETVPVLRSFERASTNFRPFCFPFEKDSLWPEHW